MNLLGKRVDYSGRSVIVVGPDFKIASMWSAKENGTWNFLNRLLFENLREKGFVHTIKGAKRMVEKAKA